MHLPLLIFIQRGMKMNLFKTKPTFIHALQWTGDNIKEIQKFVPGVRMGEVEIQKGPEWIKTGGLVIETLEGSMLAATGDWIIKGIRGEFYPCKPDVFAAKYEQVEVSEWE